MQPINQGQQGVIHPFAQLPPQDPNQQQVLDPRRRFELMALIQQLQEENEPEKEPETFPEQNPIDGTTQFSAGLGAAGNTIEDLAGIFAANKNKDNQLLKNQALSQALAQQGGF